MARNLVVGSRICIAISTLLIQLTPAAAQFSSGHFFVGSQGTPQGACPTSGGPYSSAIVEFDATGGFVRTIDLSSAFPGAGICDARPRPLTVTPWGTLLCTTGYMPCGGWFEVRSDGVVTRFYPDPSATSYFGSFGPQSAVVGADGLIYGCHFAAYSPGTMLVFDPQGSVTANSCGPTVSAALPTVHASRTFSLPVEAVSVGREGASLFVGIWGQSPFQTYEYSGAGALLAVHCGTPGQITTAGLGNGRVAAGLGSFVQLDPATSSSCASYAFCTPLQHPAWAASDGSGNFFVQSTPSTIHAFSGTALSATRLIQLASHPAIANGTLGLAVTPGWTPGASLPSGSVALLGSAGPGGANLMLWTSGLTCGSGATGGATLVSLTPAPGGPGTGPAFGIQPDLLTWSLLLAAQPAAPPAVEPWRFDLGLPGATASYPFAPWTAPWGSAAPFAPGVVADLVLVLLTPPTITASSVLRLAF